MPDSQDTPNSVTLRDFQTLIRNMYFEKDAERGIDGTFMWLMEEIGELAAALRQGTHQEKSEEFADVIAWLATIANVAEVDLGQAIQDKYGKAPELSTSGGTSDARFIKNYCTVAEFGLIGATMHKVDECVLVQDIIDLRDIYLSILEGYFSP